MVNYSSCPVCSSEEWIEIEKFEYQRQGHSKSSKLRLSWEKVERVLRILFIAKPRKKLIRSRVSDGFLKIRNDVLFNVWFTKESTIRLTTYYCNRCGFSTFFPRPTDQDIIDKYKYLLAVEGDVGGQTGFSIYAKKLDRRRAMHVYNYCIKYSSKVKVKVLDYGGGNGKLLENFAADGHHCYIIDYNENPLPGIIKLSNDRTDFKHDMRFDIIICSHVLEHVSDITKLVEFFKDRLLPNGLVYAEVPHEIWAGIKIDADPVTHVNFFTENSLKSLFLTNGFKVIDSKRMISTYGKKSIEVVKLIAVLNPDGEKKVLSADVREVLYPSRIKSILKLFAILIKPKIIKALN